MRTALIRWREGHTFDGEARGGRISIVAQAPTPEQPTPGPGPKDLVLLGLAACSAVDVVSILEKMRQPLTGLEVAVEAEEASEHPKRLFDIRLVYRVRGEGLDWERVERAVQLSQEKYCGVAETLRQGTALSYRIEQETSSNTPGGEGHGSTPAAAH